MNAMTERHCDVLVIGSGASGLAAAVTAAHHGLDVLVAEKTHQFGGTSAWSGGWLWIPCNPLAKAEGADDSAQAVESYLRAELGSEELDERQLAFLQHGPEMVEFFQRSTQVQFYSGSRMPDMHDSPGAVRGGRSLCALPYDGRLLGPWLDALRPPLDLISPGGMGIAGGADLAHFLNAGRSPRSALYVAGRLFRHWRDCLLHGRGLHLVNGNALVARLLRSALDLGVHLETGAAAMRLLWAGQRVAGAELELEGRRVNVMARRGVVLACGGFPHDRQRIGRLFGHEHLSAAPATNTGDGLRLGESMGARATDQLASPAAWTPVSRVPRKDGSISGFPHLMERAKPGFIAVRNDGRRFTNEADSYHDFMNALFRATPAGEEPAAWLICDQRAQRRYGIGCARPFPFPIGHHVRSGYLKKAASLIELAKLCGIDGEQLQATVAAFNANAAHGVDPEFQRGASAYNQAQGEPLHGPNPSLGALEKGPFHAVKLVPGSLGTFAGLLTDASARALDDQGSIIPGLYAVGNDMASVMGGHYPSGGITLGPGMTFGYLAGLSLAGEPVTPAGSAEPTRRSSPCAAP
ncbi:MULTISPECIES: FAD-dependent oxidoreductase [unclassified Pseudomonas]|uniref:FAD-dependent oxidoreductase n=2 Tax=Pseudomonas TaxID=286 RepID=UPI00129D970A|nr:MULTISPECIES: FAD-dependent oxidoreductase [unclassified Pseudomonas]MDH4652300.1 FAD-dependent oxidoreductase [Pseudomonas sp. BN606]MRK24310.1 FAD-dependent oxidoreductase [Pseudomonas sp. JG-B]